MSIRVCILGQANPFTWHGHYVRAFRRHCEVITIGPNPGPEILKGWGRDHLAHLVDPNDIEVDLGSVDDLHAILPSGWRPHLVVSISGGGVPMFTKTASLACPTVFLSIDTWQCLMEYNEAIHYDLVFAAQRAYIPYLRATGSRHVHWLPLACAPDAHYPVDVPKRFDISFVGAATMPVHRERARLLHLLADHFSVEALERVHGEDYCRHMCGGRLAFNHSAIEDLNMRIFEALAMGCPLLTNRSSAFNGLLDLFEEGKHLIVYESDEDLIDKTREYLNNPAVCEAVGRAGKDEVLKKHTYDQRVREILDTVRKHFPGFDQEAPAPRQPGDSLCEYLPRIPGTVMDFGMNLEASKYALRRRGVTLLVGISPSDARREQRMRSYDLAYREEPAGWRGKVDTVVLSDLTQWDTADEMVRLAQSILCEGGSLVARIPADRIVTEAIGRCPELMARWFHERDFHVTDIRATTGSQNIVTARKRIRMLRDVVVETFSNLQVP
ncbi:MAG: glycosyltransferase, partial [Candidatus Hydrogenedentes bacterium]|nr:glycosyltransferase [Candidatus Hydrogenedentota bacterium]